MITPGKAPETYQQWLDWMQYLQEHPTDREACETIVRGIMPSGASESFKSRLSDTVGKMLTFHCRTFLRQLDQALEDGEPDMALLLSSRFRKAVDRCSFYRQMAFLDAEYVRTLDEGFGKQISAFWADFLRQLRKTARESMDPAMEDLVLNLSRVKVHF